MSFASTWRESRAALSTNLMRTRIVLFGLAAVVIAVLVALSLADELLIDALWFDSLGYRSVFFTMVGARFGIFLAVWLAASAAILVSGLAALGLSRERERLHVVRRTDEIGEIGLPDLIRSLGERVPWKLLVAAGALVLGLFAAAGESSNWDTYLKAAYAVPFGSADPAYGRDLGFYIFTLPLLEELRDLFVLILFLAAVLSAAVYWGRGAIDFRQAPPRVVPGAIGHLSLLLGRAVAATPRASAARAMHGARTARATRRRVQTRACTILLGHR